MNATEYVLQHNPFTVRRRVKWSDCDPAGVVYTGTYTDYVVSAAELFYAYLFDKTPQQAKNHHGFGTPTRALAFDFRRTLWPDQAFDMTVSIVNIRQHTYQLSIAGCITAGEEAFRALLTPVCVARAERRAIEIPYVFRKALETYQAQCSAVATDSDSRGDPHE